MISITPYGQTGPYSELERLRPERLPPLRCLAAATAGGPARRPLEHGTFAADFFGAASASAWGLAAVLGTRSRRAADNRSTCPAQRPSRQPSWAGRTSVATPKTVVFEQAHGRRHAPRPHRPPSCPARTGTSGCLRSSQASGTGSVEVMGEPGLGPGRHLPGHVHPGPRTRTLIYPLIEEWTMQHTKMEIMEKLPGGRLHPSPPSSRWPRRRSIRTSPSADTSSRSTTPRRSGKVPQPRSTVQAPRETPGGPEHAARRASASTRPTCSVTWVSPTTSSPRFGEEAPGRSDDEGTTAARRRVRVANFGWVWAGPVTGTDARLSRRRGLQDRVAYARIDMTRHPPALRRAACATPTAACPTTPAGLATAA